MLIKSNPPKKATGRKWVAFYIIVISIWGVVFVTTLRSWIVGRQVLVDKVDISVYTNPLLVFNLVFLASNLFILLFYLVFYDRATRRQIEAKQKMIQNQHTCKESNQTEWADEMRATKQSKSFVPLCSVIIPARNEAGVIKDTILSCLAQTYRNIEVIVVCHNCDDNTYEKASQVKDSRVHAVELVTKEAGKGIALNHGVQVSKGQYLLILDGDGKLNERFLEDALPMFLEGKEIAAVQGRYIPSNRNFNFITRMLSLEGDLWSTPFMTLRTILGRRTPLGGTGYIVRRDVLTLVGGFTNHLVDDYELTFRLLRKGYKILFAPLSINYDEKPATVDIMIKQRARWVKGFFDLMKIRVAEPSDLVGNLYWVNPLTAFTGLILLVISVYATVHLWMFQYFPFNFSYIPLAIWSGLTVATFGLYTAVLFREYGMKGLRYAALLPLYLAFSNYYFVVSIKAFFVKSWAETKTTHGFVVRDKNAIRAE